MDLATGTQTHSPKRLIQRTFRKPSSVWPLSISLLRGALKENDPLWRGEKVQRKDSPLDEI